MGSELSKVFCAADYVIEPKSNDPGHSIPRMQGDCVGAKQSDPGSRYGPFEIFSSPLIHRVVRSAPIQNRCLEGGMLIRVFFKRK